MRGWVFRNGTVGQGGAGQWTVVDGAAPEVQGIGTDFGDLVE